MKKIISLMLALAVVLSLGAAAAAEETEDPAETESAVSMEDWTPVEFADAGIAFRYPAELTEVGEPEDPNCVFEVSGENLTMSVLAESLPNISRDEYLTMLQSMGYTTAVDYLELSFAHIYGEYTTDEGTVAIVAFFVGDEVYTFRATASDDDGWMTFGRILSTMTVENVKDAA